MIRTLAVGACCALLVACSTTPVTSGAATAIPPERVYAPEYLQERAGADARVTFLRDKGFSGSGCSHDVYVNNTKVLAIRQGEGATLPLPAGAYFFRLETGGGLCPNIATSQNTTLTPGEKQVYRILLPSDGGLRLTRVE